MAPRKCDVRGCTSHGVQDPTVHYHGLPSNCQTSGRWIKWLEETNGEAVRKKNVLICSEHFSVNDRWGRKLRPGAVPVNRSAPGDQVDQQQQDSSCTNSVIDAEINNAVPRETMDQDSTSTNKVQVDQDSTSYMNSVIDAGINIVVPNYTKIDGHCSKFIENDVVGRISQRLSNPLLGESPFLPKRNPTNNPQQSSTLIENNGIGNISKTLPSFSIEEAMEDSIGIRSISETLASFSIEEVMEDSNIQFILLNDTHFQIFPQLSSCAGGILPITSFEEQSQRLNSSRDENRVQQVSLLKKVPAATSNKNKVAASTSCKKKQQTKKCVVVGCSGLEKKKYFTFPPVVVNNVVNQKNLDKCKQWVQNSGNMGLLDVPTASLHLKAFICSDHFSDEQFFNYHRVTLLPNAVPTLFSSAPLSDSDMQKYPVWGVNDISTNLTLLNDGTLNVETNDSSPNVETNDGSPNVESNNDTMNVDSNNNDSLQVDSEDSTFKMDQYQKDFEAGMNSLKEIVCPKCKEKFHKPADSKVKCLHSKNICGDFSAENDMDPLDVVPEELKGLSYVEEQLIAKVHPLISVFKLNGHQYGYKGNIINFPQNVKSLATKLPHNIDDLTSLITITTGNEINPKEFHVRAGIVRGALMWLKDNNPYYYDIEVSEENLSALPDDGNVYDRVKTKIVTDADNSNFGETVIEEDMETEGDVDQVTETGVPMTGKPSEPEQIQSSIGWPQLGPQTINEFHTVGYVVQAFPFLFPYGKADLRSPRERKITPLKYFQHLLRYHDDRFAKHPRFRYFALNSIMRWSALTNGSIYMKKNQAMKDMTVADLKKELEKNPTLMKKIMYYNSNLRGTRSYWHARGKELLAMVEQLGLPTLFFTLSAADLHWPDLFHFLSPGEDPNSMTSTRRRKLVEENPAKVDEFFTVRGQAFIEKVLRKKFDVEDLWFRIEYQHRGSPHIHGVLWLKNAPKIDDLKHSSEEEILKIVSYFDQFISTKHPDINCPASPVHPCQRKLSEVVDIKRDLAELLNRVQRHTKCSEAYCLRTNKKTKKKECRFKFPRELQETSKIVISPDKDVELVTARNDPYLNKFNDYMIQSWRANIDVSPVLSKRALVNYLAKYITKSETQSEDMKEVLKSLLNVSEQDADAKSVISKLYMKSCSERNFSAQETCHLLMGLPLHSSGGRQFVTINFKHLENDSWVEIPENGGKQGKNFIEKYMERKDVHENYSLWTMAKNYKLPSGKRLPGKRAAIVQVFPNFSKQKDDNDEDFFRQKVLLHVPWRYEDQFLVAHGTWKDAYQHHLDVIEAGSAEQCTFHGVKPDEPEYEIHEPDEPVFNAQWMQISQMGVSQNVSEIELGLRDIDVMNDWHASAKLYDTYGGIPTIKSFIQDQRKATQNTTDDIPQMPNVQFTCEQESVLKLLQLQINAIRNPNGSDFALPKSIIVQGKAGTGKSLLIHAMKSLIYEAFGEDSFVLLGPTGVSAVNIRGSTIHSKLHIDPKTKTINPLTGPSAHEFRKSFEKTQFVIVDEYSMMGCNLMHSLEQRLKEAKDREDLPFGGLYMFFFGDVKQLAPVGDTAVYSVNQKSTEHIEGKLLFKSIEGSVVLSQVKRQSDPVFQKVLHNISTGNVTIEDFKFLEKRFKTSVSPEERKAFNEAIHLYPTVKEVDDYNKERLIKLKNNLTNLPVPIAKVPALHNCNEAAQGSSNDANGLRPVLYLAEGAKIMLRANLWTEKGLVNGAMGHIVHILYEEGSDPTKDPPAALVCTFDNYKGPYLDDSRKTVVIPALTKQWTNKKGTDCVRVQFPVALCYACTIHKSQGLSLEKVFINIGVLKEMSAGLTYTAISRVTSMEGLLLEPFGKKRLLGINDKPYISLRGDWENELSRKDISYLFI